MDYSNSASQQWLIQTFFSEEHIEKEIKNRKELKGFTAPVEIEHADLETIKNLRIVDRTYGQTAELFRMIYGSHLHSAKRFSRIINSDLETAAGAIAIKPIDYFFMIFSSSACVMLSTFIKIYCRIIAWAEHVNDSSFAPLHKS